MFFAAFFATFFLFSAVAASNSIEVASEVAISASPEPTSLSACLIFVVAKDLKEHITTENIEPVSVLLQHSIHSCPGLQSTFEVFQKIMSFKEMDYQKTMDFVESLKVHNGSASIDVAEIPDIADELDTPHHAITGEDEIQEEPEHQNQHHISLIESPIDDSEVETTSIQDPLDSDAPHEDEASEDSYDSEAEPVAPNFSEYLHRNPPQSQSEEIAEDYETPQESNYAPEASEISEENPEVEDEAENHEAKYQKFWMEELQNNLQEAESLSDNMI